ncbi:MAG: galactosyltransferase-related protein, partial [Actinocatenispora sp.]
LHDSATGPPDDPYALAAGGGYGRTVVNALERTVAAMARAEVRAVAPWLACVGANTSMPRRLWERAGGYDESFGTRWGCEDLELGFRLCRVGAPMMLAGGAPGIHLSHVRTDRWEQHAVNLGRFAAKHPDPTVLALSALLGPSGSTRDYLAAVPDPSGADRRP